MCELPNGSFAVADYTQKAVYSLPLNGTVIPTIIPNTEGLFAEAVCVVDGDLVVTSYDDHTVRRIGRTPWVRGMLVNPWGVVYHPGLNQIVVSEFGAARLHLLALDGSFVGTIGGGNSDLFKNPMGMAVNPEGNIIVADWGLNQIKVGK